MNILGCVLRVVPQYLPQVMSKLSATDGVEIALNPGDGRLVLILEDTAHTGAAQTFAAISLLPKVLSASLVYEHSEPEPHTDNTGPEPHTGFQAWRTTLADMAQHHPLRSIDSTLPKGTTP